MTADVSQQLVEFSRDLSLASVPDNVLDHLKLHILDQLGCQLVGSAFPWTAAVRQYGLRFGSAGPARIFPTGEGVDAEFAALVNGTAGHAFEIDDHAGGVYIAHPGCVVIPSVLAIAEETNASGQEALEAIVTGYEVTLRIARAAWPEAIQVRGIHGPSGQGPLGAALAVARLLDLDSKTTLDALGIAASHASGTVEYAQSGGEVKRLHAGMGAAAGIRSVRLAQHGLSAPSRPIEGVRGVLNAWTDTPRPDTIVEALGSEWLALAARVKPYACCAAIHAPIDAMMQVMSQHGILIDDVDTVLLGTNRIGLLMGGTDRPTPADMTSAQFSNQFALAIAAVWGRCDFRAFQKAMASGAPDPEISNFAKRVVVALDTEAEAAFPSKLVARVTVLDKSGGEHSAFAEATGSGSTPLSADVVIEKFRSGAGIHLSADRVDQLVAAILDIENLRNIAEITDLAVSS